MFKFLPLKYSDFANLFTLNDEELALLNAVRVFANSKPGYPCRVSLRYAEIGEELILLNYTSHDVDGPYRFSYAIYVSKNAQEYESIEGELPPFIINERQYAIRAFDEYGMLKQAKMVEKSGMKNMISEIFSDDNIAYLHVHFAVYGCFAAKVVRGNDKQIIR